MGDRQEHNRKVYDCCRDLIFDYLSYIRVFIKTRKATDPNIAKADTDYDMYELLFLEGLNSALRTNTKDDYLVFPKEIGKEVGQGIQKILKERRTFGYALANRKDVIFMCNRIFHTLVEKSRNMTQKRKEGLLPDE